MSKIAVLIPHYNDIEGLCVSLSSIAETEPVAVVVVDDCSKKAPVESELKSAVPQLEKIKVIVLPEHRGIEAALNAGLSFLSGLDFAYAARLDCGDICHPDRFRLQREFLDNHPEYALVGSWAGFFSGCPKKIHREPVFLEQDFDYVVQYPETDTAIRKYMLKNSAFAHQAVMLRLKDVLATGGYSDSYPGAEDYDLFFRLLDRFKAANLPCVLTACEISNSGISAQRRRQITSRIQLIWKNRKPDNLRAALGIARSLLLLIMPRKLGLFIKKIFYPVKPGCAAGKEDCSCIFHVIEAFSGGTLDVVVDLVNNVPQYRHVVVHGWRSDSSSANYRRFANGTEFIYWKNVRRLPGWRDVPAFLELLWLFFRNRKRIVKIHLHSSKAGFLGRIAAFCAGMNRKVLYTSHGAAFLCAKNEPLKAMLYTALERCAAYFGGVVVACSQSERDEFMRRDIPAEYVNNAAHVGSSISIVRKRTDEAVIKVVTAGRIVRQKNPALFNEIVDRFSGNSKIEFIWIGAGELGGQLGSNVRVTGWLSRDEVTELLRSADIYLSTSLWEGMPLSVLQAMACALPVVLSDCVGNSDLVAAGNGYLFSDAAEAADRIRFLAGNSEQRILQGSAGYNLAAEKYSLVQMIDSYSKFYNRN